MPKETTSLLAFNRGILSKLGLARIDIKRAAMSAEIQTNYMPRVLGSMMLRPGFWFRGSTLDNKKAIQIPFVFATDDTALIELTDDQMRVRVDDELLSREAVTTAIADGDFTTGDSFTAWPAVTGPATLPSSAQFIRFSPDSTVMVTSWGGGAAYYAVDGSTFTYLGTLPGLTATADSADFSPSGNLLIVHTANEVGAYIVSGSGSGVTFSQISGPPSVSFGLGGTGVAFSPNGTLLTIGSGSSPYVSSYFVSGTTFTKLADPATLPAGIVKAISYSLDSTLCAVAHATTPFVTIYSVSGSGSGTVYTKLSNPGTLPAGNGFGVAFSPNGALLAVAHATTPFVTIYSYSGTTFTKLADPSSLPAGQGNKVDFSPTGQYLAVAHNSSPYVAIYNVAGNTVTKLANPGTLPVDNSLGADFSPDGKFMVTANGTNAPVLNIYQAQRMWSDLDGSGAASTIANGQLSLLGTGFNSARRVQEVPVDPDDRAIPHTLRIVVVRGAVSFRVGTALGDASLVRETTLLPGTHSLVFTPNAPAFFIDLSATTTYATVVESVTLEAAGVLSLPTIWGEADLPFIRWTQSADVIFLACQGKRQQRIERRANGSWSITDYVANDGPFRNSAANGILLTPGSLTGDTTLTATQNFFNAGHVGALFRLTSIGQTVATSFTGDNQFSNPIRITGVGNSRRFTLNISGTWSGTVTMQRSVTDATSWTDVTDYTTNQSNVTISDGLDNQIIYYRVGIKSGKYTSGQADTIISYASGGLSGVGRVTAYLSPTLVNISVVTPFGATTATENWQEGSWSAYRGYPTSVALYEGRLGWAGKENIYLSVSDAYTSFDDKVEGDSGTIIRSIGQGPVDTINWLLPLQRLILGTQGAEKAARSSSFDEILTPTNFNMKDCSTQGSWSVAAVKVDTDGIFVQRSGTAVYRLTFDSASYDYGAAQMNQFCPEVTAPSIVSMDVQRQPDTRIHCVLSDGTVAVLVFDRLENVICWVKVETDGDIEDVAVLPGVDEDIVYYTIRRTVGGQDVRYLERWAKESECKGDALTKCADSHMIYDGEPATVITGLDHLEGKSVVAWGDGKDLGMDPAAPQNPSDTFMVSGGQITIPTACSQVVVGLPYGAQFKSTKLAYAAAQGTPLNRRKRAIRVGFILADSHAQSIKYGDEFGATMRSLPRTEGGKTIDPNYIWDHYDQDLIEMNSDWTTDSRLCLTSAAPRPVTILCATIEEQTNG